MRAHQNFCQQSVPERVQPLNGDQLMVVWKNGRIDLIPGAVLQLNCRCAKCVDEMTGERLIQESQIDPNARLLETEPVGNYGVRLKWSKGCESGIYTFDHIKEICLEITKS